MICAFAIRNSEYTVCVVSTDPIDFSNRHRYDPISFPSIDAGSGAALEASASVAADDIVCVRSANV